MREDSSNLHRTLAWPINAVRWTLVALLAGHALIRFVGFAQAFGLTQGLPRAQPIPGGAAILWLVASALVLVAAWMVAIGVRTYWIAGGVALLVSQALIMTSWHDAWAGTSANIVLFVVVAHGFLAGGPWSRCAQYLHETETETRPAPDSRSRPGRRSIRRASAPRSRS